MTQIQRTQQSEEGMVSKTGTMPWLLRWLARGSQRMSHAVLVVVLGVVVAHLMLTAFPKLSHWLMGERWLGLSEQPNPDR